jgi:glucose/arabinose dehydrogenase
MRKRMLCNYVFLALIIILMSPVTTAQDDEKKTRVTKEVHRFNPEKVDFNESLLNNLRVPEGFEISVFARDLEGPRIMAVHDDGSIFVTCPRIGEVLRLQDTNGDGTADRKDAVVTGLEHVHGITINNNSLYLATNRELYVAKFNEDGKPGKPKKLIDDMPDGGQHPNRTMAFGPDGNLYISVGSSCNACEEPNEEHATMLKVEPDGSSRSIFAEGLRNTIGFDWHPDTKEFWGMDHGSDMRGDDIPGEELNRIEEGKHYGWPFCYEDKVIDRMTAEPSESTHEEFCQKTTGAVMTYQAHSAPMDMVFYTGNNFPEEYRGDAFIAMRGSWNRSEPVGYKVVRLRFNNGQPSEFEDFVTGFLLEDGARHFARVTGVAIANDGALLVSDDSNGVIYKISYNNGGGM